MSKQMTVGKRIGLGFSVVILITVALGGLGAWSMLAAKTDSTKLATEYIPEVKVATDLRGASNRVMYQMRGYGLTEDHTYYEVAQEEIAAVNQHLGEASDLADKAVYLKALKGQVAEAKTAVDAYAALMQQTEETIAAMAAQRTKLDQNAATYMQNCDAFLKGQNEAFKRDLDDRQKKIEIVAAIVDRGTRARVQNFKAQGANDMNLLQETVTLVRGVDEEVKQLRPITRQQINIDQMDNIEAAAKKYAEAMEAYANTTGTLTTAGKKMNTNAAAYMDNCAAFLTSQNEAMKEDFGKEGANLQERLQKITLVNDVIEAGNAARITNFRAQATGDPELMRNAIEQVQGVKEITKELRKITRQAENLKQIDIIETAATTYGEAVEEYLKSYLQLDTIRKEMDAGAGAYVTNCEAFLDSQQQALTKDMHERHEKITLVNNIIGLGSDARIKAFKAQALRSSSIMQEALKNFPKLDEKYAALRAITRLDADLERIDNTKVSGENYATALTTFLVDWQKLQDLGKQREEAGQRVIGACRTTADAGMSNTDQIATESAASLSTNSTIMIVTLAIGTVVSIFFAIWIARSIMGPMNRIIAGLTEGSEQVAAASGQVSAASQSLAEGATEQAAGLEETSSSLEEMSSMTKQNADNAQQANVLGTEARKAADTGSESMGRMNQAIQDIQKSSDETAKIIKVIDEIAFQTNLLALNAAVEAARAGEAGKGFAVVAEEVRNLAMRSAEAAKNTTVLIDESVKNSKNGVDIAGEVAKVLDEIVQGIGKTTDLVSEIAAASQEQAQGIDQVNTAVSQMDKVTQQNAANAEESASASEELSAQAGSMNEVVAELMALVGGAALRKSQRGQGGQYSPARTQTNRTSGSLNAVSRKHGFGKSDEAFHRIAVGAGTESQHAIPLGEDDNLDHFNA